MPSRFWPKNYDRWAVPVVFSFILSEMGRGRLAGYVKMTYWEISVRHACAQNIRGAGG